MLALLDHRCTFAPKSAKLPLLGALVFLRLPVLVEAIKVELPTPVDAAGVEILSV